MIHITNPPPFLDQLAKDRGVEVGVGEGLLDTLIKEVIWRCIGNIRSLGRASTTGKHSDNAIVGISNDRPGVPEAREC